MLEFQTCESVHFLSSFMLLAGYLSIRIEFWSVQWVGIWDAKELCCHSNSKTDLPALIHQWIKSPLLLSSKKSHSEFGPIWHWRFFLSPTQPSTEQHSAEQNSPSLRYRGIFLSSWKWQNLSCQSNLFLSNQQHPKSNWLHLAANGGCAVVGLLIVCLSIPQKAFFNNEKKNCSFF